MRLMHIARGAYKALVKVIEFIVMLCTTLMVLSVSVNVIARYIFKYGITWIEEFTTLMFVWTVFLGAFVALRNKAHIALVFLVKRMPPRFAKINRWVVLSLSGIFLLAMAVGGIILVNNVINFGQRSAIMRISSAWLNASIAVSGILMLMELVRVALSGENITKIDDAAVLAKEATK